MLYELSHLILALCMLTNVGFLVPPIGRLKNAYLLL